jgi:hypothetical protein
MEDQKLKEMFLEKDKIDKEIKQKEEEKIEIDVKTKEEASKYKNEVENMQSELNSIFELIRERSNDLKIAEENNIEKEKRMDDAEKVVRDKETEITKLENEILSDQNLQENLRSLLDEKNNENFDAQQKAADYQLDIEV